jgi:hypothetical protein
LNSVLFENSVLSGKWHSRTTRPLIYSIKLCSKEAVLERALSDECRRMR